MKLAKKGQTEDVFADLIPSLVIIVVVLFVAGVAKMQHEESIELKLVDYVNLPLKNAAFLKTPIQLPKLETKYNNLNFGEIAEAIEKKYSGEDYEWLEQSGIIAGEHSVTKVLLEYAGVGKVFECRGDFKSYLNKIFLGGEKSWGYLLNPSNQPNKIVPAWMLQMYSVKGPDRIMFYGCTSFAEDADIADVYKYKSTQNTTFVLPSQDQGKQIWVTVTFLGP